MDNNQTLIAQCEGKAKQWLSPAFDKETRSAVEAMISNEDKTELIESFTRTWNLVQADSEASWEPGPTA